MMAEIVAELLPESWTGVREIRQIRLVLPQNSGKQAKKAPQILRRSHDVEQGTEIEPASVAWEATILPMN